MGQFRTQLGHPAKIVHNDVSSVSLEREKRDTAGLQARSLFSLSCIETVCRCASQSLETNERKDRFYDLRYIFSGRVIPGAFPAHRSHRSIFKNSIPNENKTERKNTLLGRFPLRLSIASCCLASLRYLSLRACPLRWRCVPCDFSNEGVPSSLHETRQFDG